MSDHNLLLMGDFFDHVSGDYEDVHKSHIDRGDEYYQALANPIDATRDAVNVLDIGCGSGLELWGVFAKLPNARVTCVDLSQKLADKLLARFTGRNIQFFLHSYLTYDFASRHYRYAIASATLHHLLDNEKQLLYSRLHQALTKPGCLIIGDYFVSPEEAADRLQRYTHLVSEGMDLRNGRYHFDVPTTIDNEKRLLAAAEFGEVECIWRSVNFAIIAAYTA